MINDVRQLNENRRMFKVWLEKNSISESDSYKDHITDVLEFWLEEHLGGVGNLFRFDRYTEYKNYKSSIIARARYAKVNDDDQSGRPNAALNHYLEYLGSFQPGELQRIFETRCPVVVNGRRVLSATFKPRCR